jgi:regulator of PEP synthase PpsR (kinase-PPPase family)
MNNARDYDFHWLEQRLLPLGFQIVFLKRTRESFTSAREERLKVSGNPSQYDDLNRFIEEQRLFQHLISESSLPKLEVDISDNDSSKAIENIADWMEETGALYMN